MKSDLDHFWTEAAFLAKGASKPRIEPDGAMELFIETPRGTLEITGSGEFVSVACAGLFIEDQPIRSDADVDLLLAVCDAILNGDATVSGASPEAVLRTRGYSQVWTA